MNIKNKEALQRGSGPPERWWFGQYCMCAGAAAEAVFAAQAV